MLGFEIAGDLICAVNLAQEVAFRSVVRAVNEMITADRYWVVCGTAALSRNKIAD